MSKKSKGSGRGGKRVGLPDLKRMQDNQLILKLKRNKSYFSIKSAPCNVWGMFL